MPKAVQQAARAHVSDGAPSMLYGAGAQTLFVRRLAFQAERDAGPLDADPLPCHF